MEDDGYEIVEFDPHRKLHAYYLVEPHRSHVLAEARLAARELGLDPERVTHFVLSGIEEYDESPGCMVSLLQEASVQFPPQTALGLLEGEDPGTLSSRHITMRVFSSPGFPLYTREELAALLEAAIEHLKRNRDDLIARGHPRTRFTGSLWIHVRVSWLYAIKHPDETRIVQEDGGQAVYEYVWGKRDEADVDEAGRVHVRRLIEPYEAAPLVYGLTLADAARIEVLRPKIFDLKLAVLDRLARGLRSHDGKSVESDCLGLICGALTYDEADLLLKQDGECLNFGSRTKEEIGDDRGTGMPRSVTGGLSNLLELIGHCEIELKNGVHHDLKNDLLDLARSAGLDGLPSLLGPAGYWRALGKAWRPQLDDLLNRAWERHRQGWSYFWQGYETRMIQVFETGFRRAVSLQFSVLPQHAADFAPYVQAVGEHVRVHQEVSGRIPPDLLPRTPASEKGKKLIANFSTPLGARWEDVEIRFRDGHTISVRVLDQHGVFTYTEMGMGNAKDGRPTVQWDLLRGLADGRGIFDWQSRGADRKQQKRRENLAKNLSAFFRIEGDPIALTADGKGWRTRFQIVPD